MSNLVSLAGRKAVSDRANLLPVKWDGYPISWNDAGFAHPPFMSHYSATEACTVCGLKVRMSLTRGVVHHPSKVTRHGQRVVLIVLMLFRCPECGHDTVISRSESGNEEFWDLDEFDYKPTGSFVRNSL